VRILPLAFKADRSILLLAARTISSSASPTRWEEISSPRPVMAVRIRSARADHSLFVLKLFAEVRWPVVGPNSCSSPPRRPIHEMLKRRHFPPFLKLIDELFGRWCVADLPLSQARRPA
jgi:hypothetical protein